MEARMETNEVLEKQWQFLLSRAHGRVRAVVERAAREPELRRFYPFKSLNWLRFSRKVEYPFDELPYISAEGVDNGRYEARAANGEVLCAGTLDDVMAAVIRALNDVE